MRNLLVNERDQRFVLHEQLQVEELGKTRLYGHISKEIVDLSLGAAVDLAVKHSYPIMAKADREGCRLENGNVYAPQCFKRLKDEYDKGGWPGVIARKENGGMGFPMALWAPLFEGFMHNAAFVWNMPKPFCASVVLEAIGSREQKDKYLKNLVSGRWGAAIAVNEDGSGCDAGLQTTVAVKQADGSYRIKGTKGPETGGDSNLFENIIHLVVARVQGDPANETGLSLFLVPKYVVNPDGSLGRRNDYTIVGLERKLGLNASPSCTVNFGEHGDCYAELIGEQRQGMGMLLHALSPGYLCCGNLATGIASAAYLHALAHAKSRVQGVHISQAANPAAPRVPIIEHPDVRRMLLWMKSHVEGMRAFVYFSALCMDKAAAETDPAERERWSGMMELLLPILRIYSADAGFRVAETAIQVHGRYGFFSDYPAQQFLRDVKVASIWEIATGVHALLYVAQVMGRNGGKDFAALLGEMGRITGEYTQVDGVGDLAAAVGERIGLLGETGSYFARCAGAGKLLVPIANATPFAHFMGEVCMGWLLFWQAGIAAKTLNAMLRNERIDPLDVGRRADFLGRSPEAAFYDGKVQSARYFIKNVLPQADALAAAIRNEDLSVIAVHNGGF
jgi:alkylation response protein AidB-like acyl-CoA dehydrogenase